MADFVISKYCQACGEGLIASAAMCPKCGTMVAGAPGVVHHAPKTKSTAVVLAVFFGFWAWLYTYGPNKVKFWVSLATHAILQLVYYSTQASTSSYSSKLGMLIFTTLVAIGLWLWALIDNASKPNDYYTNYRR